MDKYTIPKVGERVEIASRYISKCKRLLDVGCGEGILMYFLKGKAAKVYGIDYSIGKLRKAKKMGMEVKQCDLNRESIPFPDSFFDIATCLDVIEHVTDPTKIVKEIYRVLKAKGRLIISTPNIRFSNHVFSLLLKGHFPITSTDDTAYDGGHIHYFTFSDIQKILEDIGFKVIKKEGIINKLKRGIKGKIGVKIFGHKFMREFRSPGILIIAEKYND